MCYARSLSLLNGNMYVCMDVCVYDGKERMGMDEWGGRMSRLFACLLACLLWVRLQRVCVRACVRVCR